MARHLGVGWDLVKEIQKDHLSKRYRSPKLGKVRRIAIDEIYQGKRLGYLTIVMDLQSGAVIFVGEGKGADALEPFWKRLKRSRGRIEAVATDMVPAYISAVRSHLPKAVLVFDHFHVIKLFNEKLTKLRRDLQREAEAGLGKPVLKGIRWLLLKHPDNLDDTRDERQRLEEALKINEPLATAYYMKEELRQVWLHQPRKPLTNGLPRQPLPTSACSSSSPRRWQLTALASLHTTTLMAYPPGPWKAPTTKSKPFTK